MKIKGLCLIELLVVIVIILILSVILSVWVTQALENSRIAREIAEIRTLKKAVMMYYLDTGKLPEAPAGYRFDYLIKDMGVPNWRGPYLNRLPESSSGVYLTPWHTRFTFVKLDDPPGCYNGSGYRYSQCNHLFINTVDGSHRIPYKSMLKVDCELDDCDLRKGNIYYTGDYTDGVIVILFGLN